jgi:hypothetical protein
LYCGLTSEVVFVLQALVTDLTPDAKVRNAMNEINASKRNKEAAREKAEGDKVLLVKAAEADAEAKYLSGVGVARQRKAIVDGFKDSVLDFNSGVEGTTPKDIINMMMVTQYLGKFALWISELQQYLTCTVLLRRHAQGCWHCTKQQLRVRSCHLKQRRWQPGSGWPHASQPHRPVNRIVQLVPGCWIAGYVLCTLPFTADSRQ